MNMERVSVIIPAHNQASRLAMTLRSLCYQVDVSPEDFEVIVIDDGSEDETYEVLQTFASLLPLKAYVQKKEGRAAARNAAVAKSSYPLLLFTDADRMLANTWIREHRRFHQYHTHAVGVGDIQEFYFSQLEKKIPILEIAMSRNFTDLLHMARSYNYWKLIKQTVDEYGYCRAGAPWIMSLIGNLSLRRASFDVIAGFDGAFTSWGFEHFDFGYRLYKQGFSFWYVQDAANYHLAHGRPRNFYEEQMQRGFTQFFKKFSDPTFVSFWQFLRGEISLGSFDRSVMGGVSCLPAAILDCHLTHKHAQVDA